MSTTLTVMLILVLWTFAGVFLALFIDLEGKKPNIIGKLIIGPAWLLLKIIDIVFYIINFLFKKVIE